MHNDKGYLTPEDYAEPRCLLCDEPYGVTRQVKAVPQQRIIQKMNEYMAHRDYDGAERHLKYWLEEAHLGNDKGGALMIRGELIGHYRKTCNKAGAFESIAAALALLEELQMEDTRSAGTTYVNAATAYNAFGEDEKALALFEKAKCIYEANEDTDISLLGGLYNNMALCYAALGEFEKAFSLFELALSKMEQAPDGGLERAITYLNMADTLAARDGESAESTIEQWLDKAYSLLVAPDVKQDGYYAFVCEKCAPGFAYHGYFLAANELKKKAEQLYERA